MKKKLPAGLVIVLAVLFLMTAVAAAVTNGFGLLRYYPEQAENTAFTDRIVSVGQTWEGKYFSAEIKEAVFDGYKLRFSMSVTPKEGTEQVYALPAVKALCGNKELATSILCINGWAERAGFWVPDLKPLIPREGYDLNDLVYEVALMDKEYNPAAVSGDVEWTITFNVLHTDWKISFEDSGFGSEGWTEADWKAFKKREYEAYDRHELMLDEYGYEMEDIIQHPYVNNDMIVFEGDDIYQSLLDMYTREVFTLREQATFSFVADRAEVRKAAVPVSFVLPEEQKYEVTKAEATADGFCITITRPFKYSYEADEYDLEHLPWTFTVKSEEAELEDLYTTLRQGANEFGRSAITYILEYNTNKPVSCVTLIPVQCTESGKTEREDLAIVLELE